MLRAILLAASLCLSAQVSAQSFDNFERSTLPPGPLPPSVLPGSPQALEGTDDPLAPDWLDGDAVLLPRTDDGVSLTPGINSTGVILRGPGGVPVTSVSQPLTVDGSRITVRALDRMLGRPTDIEIGTGETVLFGRIAINVPECRFPADNPASDAFAHVRVFDTAGGALFDGWMVASSPALSALEHPRYDVWVLRCANTS